MKLKKVSIKNFMSYGNQETIIDFISGNLDLICGDNGSGKSSILMAIIYALYVKVTGNNLSDLVNRFNDRMMIELELECKGKNLLIKRGYKPSVLQFFIDDKEVTELASKKSMQDIIMDYIEIPFEIFTNLALINISKYQNFFTIPNRDRKDRISTIFNLNEITAMWNVNHDNFKEYKKQYIIKQNETNYIKNEIEEKNNQIKELKENELAARAQQESNEKLKNELNEKIENEISELERIKNELNELAARVQQELNENIEKQKFLELEIQKLKQELESIDRTELENLEKELKLKQENQKLLEKEKEEKEKELENKKLELIELSNEFENQKKVLENKRIEKEKIIEKNQEGIEKLRLIINKIEIKKKETSDIQSKIDLIDSGKCPLCKSDLATDEHKVEKENYIKEKEKIELEISVLRDRVTDFEHKISKIKSKSEQILNYIKDKETKQESSRSVINALETHIGNLNIILETNNKQIKQNKIDLEKKENRIKEIENSIIEKKQTKEDIENKKKELEKKELELNNIIKELKEKTKKFDNEKENTKIKIIELENSIEENKKKKQSIELELRELQIGRRTQLELLEKQTDKKNKELVEAEKEELEIKENIRITELVENVLSENGFKAIIFDTLIPVLNKHIEYFLRLLDASEFRLVFDSKLDFDLSVNNESIDIRVLSSGELKKVELALLLSLIAVLKLQYGNLNILMLDEVLITLSVENVQRVIDLLNILKEKLNVNIMLMHHMTLDEANFDRVISIRKPRLFSEVSISH